MRKKLLILLPTTLLLTTLLLTGTGFYLLDYSLRPEALDRSRDTQGSFDYLFETYPETVAWMDSLTQAGGIGDVWMENDEGVRLHALAIDAPQPTRNTAVVVHGYTDNSIRMLMIAYLYHRQLGYNVLLPDLYGHGLSEGDHIRMGWKDRLDLLLWTEQADERWSRRQQSDDDWTTDVGTRQVIHGISMGAATTLMAAGELQHGLWQRPYVKCVVEDCGYTSVWDEFAGELKNRFSLPSFPLMHIADRLCLWRHGWSFRQASALEAVKRCTLPILFIHGTQDDFVPTPMVHRLYRAKSGPKELWTPTADHAHAYRDHREEYTRRVADFVRRHMDAADK